MFVSITALSDLRVSHADWSGSVFFSSDFGRNLAPPSQVLYTHVAVIPVVVDAMPRFFFHVRRNGGGRSCDDLGLCYPSAKAACTEAWRNAQGLETVFQARGEDPRDHAIVIENDAGEVVLLMSFADIFDGSESSVGPYFQDIRHRKQA